MVKYFNLLAPKYLVSGPAPLGRILNYIVRIKLKKYKTSIRGPRNSQNLDDWTVSFMVGLGLIKKPTYSHHLLLELTQNGESIYKLIKNLPKFPDRRFGAKYDMRKIKSILVEYNTELYNFLRYIFLESDSLKNFSIFLKNKNRDEIKKHEFKQFGKIFGVGNAWFNRVPSVWQIAEFCGILEEKENVIKIYDKDYIKNFTISDISEISYKMLCESFKESNSKRKENISEYEEDFLKDVSPSIAPSRKKVILRIIKRNSRITKRLKVLYNNKCQICGFTFKKKNGTNYSEAHHIIPLGQNGYDSINNVIIVCANCHRKLTYANIVIGKIMKDKRMVFVNGVSNKINYNSIHFKAIKESDVV